MMEQHIIDAVLAAMGVAGTGILGYLVRAVVMFIVSKHLETLARQAVHFAEDAYKELGGADKLEAASEWVAKRLRKLHIKIDAEDVREAVQGAYNAVKEEFENEFEEAE